MAKAYHTHTQTKTTMNNHAYSIIESRINQALKPDADEATTTAAILAQPTPSYPDSNYGYLCAIEDHRFLMEYELGTDAGESQEALKRKRWDLAEHCRNEYGWDIAC